MKKIEHYSTYVILGLPVAITTVITHQLGFSGLYNLLVGLIMTFYSMFAYFKPNKKNNISSIVASFFYLLDLYWYQPSLLLFQYGC
jgi:hypothetical protein